MSSRRKRRVLDLAAAYRQTRQRLKKLSVAGVCPSPGELLVHDADISSTWDLHAQRCPEEGLRCHVAVSGDDGVSAAVRISRAASCRAFLLSFASKNIPGGAVASGVLAQEECIFRQTSISLALDPGSRPRCYPLSPGRVVVVRNVAVIRGAHPDYEWHPVPFPLIDVASSAAEQHPPSDGRHYADDSGMRSRVAGVLQAAALNGSTHLVLGAWGCGGFRNPALGLAEIFRSLLVDDNFARFFRYVEFAIPGDDCKHTAPFREVFGDLLQPALFEHDAIPSTEIAVPLGSDDTVSEPPGGGMI